MSSAPLEITLNVAAGPTAPVGGKKAKKAGGGSFAEHLQSDGKSRSTPSNQDSASVLARLTQLDAARKNSHFKRGELSATGEGQANPGAEPLDLENQDSKPVHKRRPSHEAKHAKKSLDIAGGDLARHEHGLEITQPGEGGETAKGSPEPVSPEDDSTSIHSGDELQAVSELPAQEPTAIFDFLATDAGLPVTEPPLATTANIPVSDQKGAESALGIASTESPGDKLASDDAKSIDSRAKADLAPRAATIATEPPASYFGVKATDSSRVIGVGTHVGASPQSTGGRQSDVLSQVASEPIVGNGSPDAAADAPAVKGVATRQAAAEVQASKTNGPSLDKIASPPQDRGARNAAEFAVSNDPLDASKRQFVDAGGAPRAPSAVRIDAGPGAAQAPHVELPSRAESGGQTDFGDAASVEGETPSPTARVENEALAEATNGAPETSDGINASQVKAAHSFRIEAPANHEESVSNVAALDSEHREATPPVSIAESLPSEPEAKPTDAEAPGYDAIASGETTALFQPDQSSSEISKPIDGSDAEALSQERTAFDDAPVILDDGSDAADQQRFDLPEEIDPPSELFQAPDLTASSVANERSTDAPEIANDEERTTSFTTDLSLHEAPVDRKELAHSALPLTPSDMPQAHAEFHWTERPSIVPPHSAPISGRSPGEAIASQTERVDRGEPSAYVDRAQFLHRVSRAFQIARQRDGEVRLRLHPPELGELRVELKVEEGALTARVEAETEAARSLLVENLPTLRQRLNEQNVRVESFQVDVMDRHDRPSDHRSFDTTGGGAESHDGRRHDAPRQRPAPPRLEGTTECPTAVKSTRGLNVVI